MTGHTNGTGSAGLLETVRSLLASRRAVKGVQGEAKIERQKGHKAPTPKEAFLRFRLLARPATALVVAYVYTRFPVLEQVLGEADIVVDFALGAWFLYICRSVPSDIMRLSADVGTPHKPQKEE